MFSGPATGLFSSPNPFSATPAGTLKRGNNVRFTAPGVLEPRRGFDVMSGSSFGDSDSLADALAFYAGTILVAYDLTAVAVFTSGSFSDFSGTYAPVGANRMRFEGAARCCYFNTARGTFMWDGTGFSGEPVLAGNPRPLTATVVADSVNGWQTADTAVAYRYTFCFKDAFGRVVEGPPSGRTTLRNVINVPSGDVDGQISRSGTTVTVAYGAYSGPYILHVGDSIVLTPGEADFPAGAKIIDTVDNANSTFTYEEAGPPGFCITPENFLIATSGVLTIPLPVDSYGQPVNTSNFVRLYRSDETATATDTPSDEMFQCYESPYLTATDISNGYITVNDTAPPAVCDFPLYTNQNTGDGALQANYRPPLALDVAYWANRMWYANTTELQSATLTLLGCGSPDGLQEDDTIHIRPAGGDLSDDVVVTAKAAPSAPEEFQLFLTGDPGDNIERTARALCDCLNALPVYNPPTVPSEPQYAYYVSAEGGLPGQILLVARNFGLQPSGESFGFSVFSARGTAFSPNLPDPTTPLWPALISTDDRHPARLKYSRLAQPEAVPLVNYLDVNSDNDAILRIFPLNYRLLIFKTDGIYTCTNVEPFSISKLSAYKLLAPDSVQVLEDRVYALTDQGIITISDAGVVEVSEPIDDVFNALNAPAALEDFATRTFGMSYRSRVRVCRWRSSHRLGSRRSSGVTSWTEIPPVRPSRSSS